MRAFGICVRCRISSVANKASCFEQVSLLSLTASRRLPWAAELSSNVINHILTTTTMPATTTTKKGQVSGASAKPASSTTTKTTKKRKIETNAQKYYAVRSGNKPGVYLTWAECQEQTAGFRGASCTCEKQYK
ncbi:hypothetical protein F5Y19DRAFT_37741 [Xylariaceae sp. FL1651]|nr:hypothetical protein F5Y19DRAFT_37741 [Xylariaceae sp. FL1651]